jgi:hypothetical protein
MVWNLRGVSVLLAMNRRLFLALTASDEWLTAPQILERLTTGSYWESEQSLIPVQHRLEYVIRQLESLKNLQGKLLFASVETLNPSGKPVHVYKQIEQFGPGT